MNIQDINAPWLDCIIVFTYNLQIELENVIFQSKIFNGRIEICNFKYSDFNIKTLIIDAIKEYHIDLYTNYNISINILTYEKI